MTTNIFFLDIGNNLWNGKEEKTIKCVPERPENLMVENKYNNRTL
jgi:hypothetical protein